MQLWSCNRHAVAPESAEVARERGGGEGARSLMQKQCWCLAKVKKKKKKDT